MIKNKKGRLLPSLIFLFLIPPLAYVIFNGVTLSSTEEDINHLLKIVPQLTWNTVSLGFWTALFSLFFGITLSVITSLTNYRYSKILQNFLILPLGMPLYIGSFIYLGFTDYGSWANLFFLKYLNLNLGLILESSGPIWIGFVFSLFLSPYITIPLMHSMKHLGANQWPIAKTMGLKNIEVIFKIIIPSLRGWIIGPTILILMEVFSDFGGVSAFNYDTLSLAIYTSWTGFYSFALALKISFILLVFSLIFFTIDHKFKPKYKQKDGSNVMSHPPIHLTKTQEWICHLPVIFYFSFALIIPIINLITWSLSTNSIEFKNAISLGFETFRVGVTFGALFVLLSIGVTFALNRGKTLIRLKSFALLGYSIPGPIVALSFIGVTSYVSKVLSIDIQNTGYIILFFAVFYKYILVAEKNWTNVFTKLPANANLSAKIFSKSSLQYFQLTYLPLIKYYFVPIFLILFLEIIKELPITLMLRPLSYQSLPIKIYELTSEGEWEQASIYSLFLLVIGLPLSYIINKRKVVE